MVEPFSLWNEVLPAAYRSVARQRVVDENGRERLFHHGDQLDLEWTIGTLCTPGSGSIDGRLDVDLDTEVHPGVADPRRRLEVMDRQGVAVSVLFPSCTLGLDDVPDLGMRHAYAEAYNDWIGDFCSTDPVRLRWGAVVPVADVEWALGEVERSLARGASTVMLSPIPLTKPGGTPFASPDRHERCVNLGHRSLDPLWACLVAHDRPAVIHAVNPASNALGMGWLFANRVQWQMGQPWQMQLALLHIIEGGSLDRHPDLRVGFFEGDIGWLPHWLGRMEQTYDKFALLSRKHERRPTESFQQQCWISGEPADRGLRHAIDLVGADRCVFGSDWPHMDGAWPDPIAIVRDRTDLDDEMRRSFLRDAPAALFGIDLGALVRHLDASWSMSAPMSTLRGMLPPRYRPGEGTAAAMERWDT